MTKKAAPSKKPMKMPKDFLAPPKPGLKPKKPKSY